MVVLYVFQLDGAEGNEVEKGADGLLDLRVEVEGEVPSRFARIVRPDAFVFLATIGAEEKEAAGSQDALYLR